MDTAYIFQNLYYPFESALELAKHTKSKFKNFINKHTFLHFPLCHSTILHLAQNLCLKLHTTEGSSDQFSSSSIIYTQSGIGQLRKILSGSFNFI